MKSDTFEYGPFRSEEEAAKQAKHMFGVTLTYGAPQEAQGRKYWIKILKETAPSPMYFICEGKVVLNMEDVMTQQNYAVKAKDGSKIRLSSDDTYTLAFAPSRRDGTEHSESTPEQLADCIAPESLLKIALMGNDQNDKNKARQAMAIVLDLTYER